MARIRSATMQHLVGRALIGGLCVAAAVAIFALLGGQFDETHARVIGTAFGFSVFAAFAGAGDALRSSSDERYAAVGAATLGVSVVAFVLLLIPIWLATDDEIAWQAWGVAAVLSLCGSHASLVLRGVRPNDTPRIGALVTVSIACAVIVTLFAVLAIVELFDDVDEGWGRAAAVVLVILLLTTALPPLMRRFGGAAPAAAASAPRGAPSSPKPDAGAPLSVGALADEVAAAADRLEQVEGTADVRREAAALRELAERARG